MLNRGNMLQEWQDHLLNPSTADFLLNEDHSVPMLQAAIANIEDGTTDFAHAFARLATYFAAPMQETDLIRCLRATLQILVLYSIVHGDHQWTTTQAIKKIERLGVSLGRLLFQPLVPREDGKVCMEICLSLASLFDKAAAAYTLRGAIIRELNTLTNVTQLSLPFRHYDPENSTHIKNAADLLTKLHPDLHSIIGMAFTLVMHPVSSEPRYKDFPPVYEEEQVAENPLIEI
ncbi:MAG: hypothetical protein Q9182_001837 [Xanthomendoza sp. 2 TL-2023]